MAALERLRSGFSREEHEKARTYLEMITSKIPRSDPERDELVRQAELGVKRDIQAQRLSPNIRVPPRRRPIKYLQTMRKQLGSWPRAARSFLSPGSWTSSGGSFKLAEDAGYDIPKIMDEMHGRQGNATFLEIGAGYAGFKSPAPVGISRLAKVVGGRLGKSVNIHFTNLTKWHDGLPLGITEHPGVLARDIAALGKQIGSADVIFSQVGAYFEPRLADFISGASHLLRVRGYLMFNAPSSKHDEILRHAGARGLILEKMKEFGGHNGNFYVFRKKG